MLLARGRVIYFNQAKFAVDYFSKINYRCPQLSNPADYFMQIMSIESIEKVDSADQSMLSQSESDVLKKYAERIGFFSKQYEQSKLKNDCDFLEKSVRPLEDGSKIQTSSFFY